MTAGEGGRLQPGRAVGAVMNVILIKPSPDIEVQAFEVSHDRRQKKARKKGKTTSLLQHLWGKIEEQVCVFQHTASHPYS